MYLTILCSCIIFLTASNIFAVLTRMRWWQKKFSFLSKKRKEQYFKFDMWAQESRIILVLVLLWLINSKPGQNCLCKTRKQSVNNCFFIDDQFSRYQCLKDMSTQEEFLAAAGSKLGKNLKDDCNFKNHVFTFCVEYLISFD